MLIRYVDSWVDCSFTGIRLLMGLSYQLSLMVYLKELMCWSVHCSTAMRWVLACTISFAASMPNWDRQVEACI